MIQSEPLAVRDVIDVDLWVEQATYASLVPYMATAWREYLNLGKATNVAVNGNRSGLPRSMFWTPGPAIGALSGAEEAKASVVDYADRHKITAAILNSGAALGVSSLASPRFAMEIARASNDWLRAEWLEADARFVGSIVVSARAPSLAAAEVHRLGDDPRFVQVQFAYPTVRLGRRELDPLYEVAAAHGLPVQLLAGAGYAGANRGIAGVGHPVTKAEYEVDLRLACQPHLASLLASDVLERHPSLEVVVSGFGVAWIPAFVWSVHRAFGQERGQQALDLFTRRVRVTTVGAEVPRTGGLGELLALISGSEQQLMCGSGDQRPDDPDAFAVANALPPEWREPVLRGNAARTFRFPKAARA